MIRVTQHKKSERGAVHGCEGCGFPIRPGQHYRAAVFVAVDFERESFVVRRRHTYCLPPDPLGRACWSIGDY